MANNNTYPASLEIDYPESLNRVTSFFRIIWCIPIFIIIGLLTYSGGGRIASGLFAATALMILFRQRYPRWWFDFALQLNRFTTRVGAYLFLLTDRYPSTVDEQSVKLNLEYPDAERDLNRWLPLVKWLLAIPHYIILMFLGLGAVIATIIAWFAILFTGRYPRVLFDFVVGVMRWNLRVNAYVFLLLTDKYPPFSLD